MATLTASDIVSAIEYTEQTRRYVYSKITGASSVPTSIEFHISNASREDSEGSFIKYAAVEVTYRRLPDVQGEVGGTPCQIMTRQAVVDALCSSLEPHLSEERIEAISNRFWRLIARGDWKSLGKRRMLRRCLKEINEALDKRRGDALKEELSQTDAAWEELDKESSAIKSIFANALGSKSTEVFVIGKIINQLKRGQEIRLILLPQPLPPSGGCVARIKFHRTNQSLNFKSIVRAALTGRATTGVNPFTHGNHDIVQDFEVGAGLRFSKVYLPKSTNGGKERFLRPPSSTRIKVGSGKSVSRPFIEVRRRQVRLAQTKREAAANPNQPGQGVRFTISPDPAIRLTLAALWLAVLLLAAAQVPSKASDGSAWIMPALAAVLALVLAYRQEGLLTSHLATTTLALVAVGGVVGAGIDAWQPWVWNTTLSTSGALAAMQLVYLFVESWTSILMRR